jgi:hypothetical protein
VPAADGAAGSPAPAASAGEIGRGTYSNGGAAGTLAAPGVTAVTAGRSGRNGA